jgi:lambda family phage minor tail protein L
MPRILNASYTIEKNQLEGMAPIRLFEVEYADSAASKVHWAAWNKNIDFFLPGTATPQTYTAAPVEISDMTYSKIDRNPTMNIKISNVDRSIIAYLEQNDALRGRAITVLDVFQDLLHDSDAFIQEKYYVDGATTSRNSAQLELVPKSTIYNITIPKRVYRRNQCQWSFKSEQCSGSALGGTPTNATLRSDSGINTCLKTLASCDDYGNAERYGGFPGIPKERIYIPM